MCIRDSYESEIGHFKKAITPEVVTFRESLPLVAEALADKKDQPIIMYCTGGIRCEKASAYLKHHGFNEVYQLDGGIIKYAHDVEYLGPVSYTHLRAHETVLDLVCRLLLEKKKNSKLQS